MILTFKIESNYWTKGLKSVVGIDEVGKGCLAGPVFAGAVLFGSSESPTFGVDDSKKLTEVKRVELVPLIKRQALAWGVGTGSVSLINRKGISEATHVAMRQALAKLSLLPDVVMVDGPWTPRLCLNPKVKIIPIIKGDSQSYSIAAASILAKVARDNYMSNLGRNYPEYHWSENKGYATTKHRLALKTWGPTSHHRTLFIRKVLSYDSK